MRPLPRFPQSKDAIDYVQREIDKAVETWAVGPKDLAICGAARGADILFAQACYRRGAHLRLLIPLPEIEFLAKSVSHPNGDWVARYYDLKKDQLRCEFRFQYDEIGKPRQEHDVWERNNRWIINTARTEAPPDPIYALLVWDKKDVGDGAGGTSHFSRLYREASGGIEPVIIDPKGAR